jgi:hypothetical protein
MHFYGLLASTGTSNNGLSRVDVAAQRVQENGREHGHQGKDGAGENEQGLRSTYGAREIVTCAQLHFSCIFIYQIVLNIRKKYN